MFGNQRTALLYPWMEPEDTPEARSRLLTTALYWDKARTIVPFDFDEPFRSELAKEAIAAGFLFRHNVDWHDDEVKAASDYFERRIKDARSNTERFPLASFKRSEALIYPSKMTRDLRELIDPNYSERSPVGRDPFSAPAELATAYMHRLALEVAASRDFDAVMSGNGALDEYVNQLSKPSVGQIEGQIVEATFRRIGVNADTAVRDVIVFRQENKSTLDRFRSRVRTSARSIVALSDPRERAREVKLLVKELEQEQEAMVALLDGRRIPWIEVGVVVAGSIAFALTANTVPLGALIALAATEGLGGVLVLKQVLRKPDASMPTAYLIEVGKKFAG